MKLLNWFAIAGCLMVAVVLAQDAPAAKSPAQEAEEKARYVALSRRELELNTRFKLLSDLAEEHRARSNAASSTNRTDAALWESDRARELADRAARELTELNAATRQRMALEDGAAGLAAPGQLATVLKTNAVVSDEAAFLAKLQERSWEVEQEMTSVTEAGKLWISQLQTNNLPDEVARVSLQLEENGRQIRRLQKEMADLELRRLQYRALRSAK